MWQNRGALRTFVSASPHKEAMQRLPYWCDEGAFADWEEDSTQWPHWEEAAQRLSANGRLAPVLYPSAQQQQGKVVTS